MHVVARALHYAPDCQIIFQSTTTLASTITTRVDLSEQNCSTHFQVYYVLNKSGAVKSPLIWTWTQTLHPCWFCNN